MVKKGKQDTRRLDLATWLAAWDRRASITAGLPCVCISHSLCKNHRYTLAAVGLEQMSHEQCAEHKAVVLEVACLAAVEKRSPLLAVLYDEGARCVVQ